MSILRIQSRIKTGSFLAPNLNIFFMYIFKRSGCWCVSRSWDPSAGVGIFISIFKDRIVVFLALKSRSQLLLIYQQELGYISTFSKFLSRVPGFWKSSHMNCRNRYIRLLEKRRFELKFDVLCFKAFYQRIYHYTLIILHLNIKQ